MTESTYLIIGVSLLVAVVILALSIYTFLQTKKVSKIQLELQQQNLMLETSLKKLQSKIEFLNAGSLGLGQRLMSTEKRLTHSLEKQDELVHNNSEQLYRRQADRLLKNSSINVQESDAVTRSEAKLMALVGKKHQDNN
ncbi:hypothetical protein FT643_01920 [Ketobacter sp. MCCC 1A13808]|uniref:hypothetical protein n=1 Tax=Ketobacter sp. MCCC 1A13808 TaxID=2602738 RepID=UPI0012EB0739|nr:hypothetical protein [Ketobacter sp. MCCC 1A13808]MVF10888.1 hypothetical protein [Ketobacter sp. MCCC 1A13808]